MQLTCDDLIVGDTLSGLFLARELAKRSDREILVLRLAGSVPRPEMMVRPHVLEFDSWAAQGCAAWTPEQVLPLYKQIEQDLDFGQLNYHGNQGPLPVRRPEASMWSSLDHGFRIAALEMGHPWAEDHNAPGVLGVSPIAWTADEQCLLPASDRINEELQGCSNVRILEVESVSQVLLEDQRAKGVQAQSREGCLHIFASEVMLCAGPVHSAAILQRSGIGPATALKSVGIKPLVDLPVGQGLQVHPVLPLRSRGHEPAATSGGLPAPEGILARWNTGLEGTTSGDLMAWTTNATPRSAASILGALAEVRSRGQVLVRSADPSAGVTIDPGMLRDSLDGYRMRLVYRHLSDLSQRPSLRSVLGDIVDSRGEAWDPARPESQLDEWIISRIEPLGDYAGGCRMGAVGDPEAVTDDHGRVIGAQGLRVADSSLQPGLVKAPPALTEAVIGRRVGVLILTEAQDSSAGVLAKSPTSEILR